MVMYVFLGAALVSAVVAGHLTPHPLRDIGHWVDMTYEYGPDSVHWPDYKDFQLTSDLKTFLADGDDKYWVEANTICSPEHLGTHMDAPAHFAKNKSRIGDIPLSHLVAPGVRINLSKEANNDSDYTLTKERILQWEEKHGIIPHDAIVFMYFDWERRWPSASEMFNTKELHNNASYRFPGLDPDAADWLVRERYIVGVGTDTPSIDAGKEIGFPSHYKLYENNIFGLEFVANLSRLPETHFDVFVGPVKLQKGSGSPARIAAFVLKDDAMAASHHPKHQADSIVGSYASKNLAKWVDLTHQVTPEIPKWPFPNKALEYTDEFVGTSIGESYLEYKSFCMAEHIGTHIDAPRHYNKNGNTVNEIPLEHLMGIPGVKIDLKEKASKDPNAVLAEEDIQDWERRNGPIPSGSVVFLEFGWAEKWPYPEVFLGSPDITNSDTFNFPGFGKESVEWLSRERKVVGFGTEAVSLDVGASRNFLAHRAMSDNQLYGLENLADLDQIPEKDFTVFILPYKIRGGSGAPARVYVVKDPAYKSAVDIVDQEPVSEEEPSSEPEPTNKASINHAATVITIFFACLFMMICK